MPNKNKSARAERDKLCLVLAIDRPWIISRTVVGHEYPRPVPASLLYTNTFAVGSYRNGSNSTVLSSRDTHDGASHAICNGYHALERKSR